MPTDWETTTLTSDSLRQSPDPVILAKDNGDGTWSPVSTNLGLLSVSVGGAPGADAFGRLRVADPATLFESKQVHDAQPLLWDDQEVSGGGTGSSHDADRASTTLSVSNTTAGRRVRQTFRRFNYQAGKSQLVLMTGVAGALSAGITKRMGYYDDDNGIFIEASGTSVRVVRRSNVTGSPVDTAVEQANWDDPMDGTGASGVTLDVTKAQILLIDMEWLGVGSVRCGWVVDGAIRYFHTFNHANSLSSVYMSTANLPLRYELVNDGTGAAATLECICAQVSSEGGSQSTGYPRVADRAATVLTTLNDGNLYPLVSVRLKSTYLGAEVRPTSVSIVTPDTCEYRWALLLNPTVAGTALSYSSVANSAIEADVATSNATTVSGGTVIASGYGRSTNQGGGAISLGGPNFALGSSIAGVQDQIVLAVQRLSGTTISFYGSLGWTETS